MEVHSCDLLLLDSKKKKKHRLLNMKHHEDEKPFLKSLSCVSCCALLVFSSVHSL